MKLIKNTFLILLISFILLEFGLAVLSSFINPKIELPTYSLENTQSFWFDLSEDFGTWHLPNHSYRQKKTCFDVTYTSNEHGFRDKARSKNNTGKRVLVLGDSFIEGIGVESNERLSNLLEKETQLPHLNFGLAGNFGPTQYAVLYEKLASKFDHDAIIVAVLPANDFIDDDLEINKKLGSNRYKPYWKGNHFNYHLVYFQDSIHKSAVNKQDLKPVKKIFKNFTYSYNYLLYLKTKWRENNALKNSSNQSVEIPSYFTFTEGQLERLKHSLAFLKSIAKDKKMILLTIPTAEEILVFKETKKNPLGESLQEFSIQYDIEYLDLLPISASLEESKIKELFLPCDGHWSAAGNEFAKQKILNSFSFYK